MAIFVTMDQWIETLKEYAGCQCCGSKNVLPMLFPNTMEFTAEPFKSWMGKTGIGIICNDCFAAAFITQEDLYDDTHKVHELKMGAQYFDEMVAGKKLFELRKDDRPFEVGDVLVLNRYLPEEKEYTGERIEARIVGLFGREDREKTFLRMAAAEEGYVILSLGNIIVFNAEGAVVRLYRRESFSQEAGE